MAADPGYSVSSRPLETSGTQRRPNLPPIADPPSVISPAIHTLIDATHPLPLDTAPERGHSVVYQIKNCQVNHARPGSNSSLILPSDSLMPMTRTLATVSTRFPLRLGVIRISHQLGRPLQLAPPSAHSDRCSQRPDQLQALG